MRRFAEDDFVRDLNTIQRKNEEVFTKIWLNKTFFEIFEYSVKVKAEVNERRS